MFEARVIIYALAALAAASSSAQSCGIPLASVTDGDTIRTGKEKIRIANIDAPELRKPQSDAERRLALLAKNRLAQLLASGEIALKRGDPQDGRLKDRRGQTLATVKVDGEDVGEILVTEGLARPWTGRRQPWCR